MSLAKEEKWQLLSKLAYMLEPNKERAASLDRLRQPIEVSKDIPKEYFKDLLQRFYCHKSLPTAIILEIVTTVLLF